MRRIPLRFRLALVYGLILGIALGLAALLTANLVAQNLLHELDGDLSVRSSELHRALNVGDEGFDIGHLTGASLQIPVNEFADSGTYIQVIDESGRLVAASTNLPSQALPTDPVAIADGLAAKPSLVTVTAGQGGQLRVLTTPMIHRQHVVGLLQVAASLRTINAALSRLSYELALGSTGLWLLALLLVWWVVARALRPVARISSFAERIAATGDVDQRIVYEGAKDELGELAGTFNRMLERIQRSFTAHRQFVADSSHQLATPLTVIRGNAELLAQELTLEDRRECIAAIRGEVERMDKIVGDLLTLAQLDARPKLARRYLRLDKLAQEAVGQVRSIAGSRQLLVSNGEPVAMEGDPDALGELLLNLLHNAIKYSADATTITVRVEASAKGSRDPSHHEAAPSASLAVSDEGLGIPAEDLEHVFDRFYRVNRKMAQAQRGAGLGLAIVKAIAEAHGGKIAVRSEVGRGSEFTVTFDVVPTT